MSCKYITWRSRKGIKYSYCRLKKEENCNCYHCEEKEYKTYQKKKKHKTERIRSTEIQKGVKEIVWNRDGKKCIFCETPVSMFYANAHLVPRSQGGLGIEENIFTACDECHLKQDNGLNTLEMEEKAEQYLKSKYLNWSRKKLIYRKEY